MELTVVVEFQVEEGDRPGRFAATLDGYRNGIRHADGPMHLAYHWHPVGVSPVTWPHLHVGGTVAGIDLSRAHLPTGQVALPDVLRFAIVDLGVRPLRDDWPDLLKTA